MGFGKPLHIVVFARRGQLAGQIRKDAEDVLVKMTETYRIIIPPRSRCPPNK